MAAQEHLPADLAIPQLAEATAQAPQWAAEWYQKQRQIDSSLVGLGRIGGGAWCAIGADSEQAIGTVRCLTPDGQETTPEAWHQQRRAAEAEARGAMSAGLDHHLQQLTTSELTSALLWARHEPPAREAGPGEAARVAGLHWELRQALHALCEVREGCTARDAVVDGPMVEIVATPEALRSLAREALVGAIDHLDPNAFAEPAQVPTVPFRTMECVRIDEADALYSADGSGVTVAVVEGGEPPPALLAEIPNYAGSNCTGLSPAIHTHASAVMSVIQANSYGARPIDGSAVGADVTIGGVAEECFACIADIHCRSTVICDTVNNYCNYGPFARHLLGLEWSAQNGAAVINFSQQFGSFYCGIDAPDPYFDGISRYMDYLSTISPYPVVVPITGNRGANRVSSAATYNGLVVGGVDHENSVSRTNHTAWDDAQCASNSYDNGIGAQARNRLGLDSLEVPHVVAPAKDVAYLARDGNGDPYWLTGDGTSLAAPHVSGIAARIFEVNSNLDIYPEAVRAIIMASASEDVDGGALNLLDGVDDRDGVGEVDAYEAERVAVDAGASNCWGSTGSPCGMRGANRGPLYSSDFSAPGNYFANPLYFGPTSGSTVRIALHWMNNATCTPSTLSCSGGPDSPMTLALWLWRFNPGTGLWGLVGVSLQPNPEDNYLYIQTSITPNDLYRINFNYPGLVANRSTYYGLSWMTR